MVIFLVGLFIFLGIHSVSIVYESWRNRVVDNIGESPWKGIYSLVSIVGFFAMIYGYGLARYDSSLLYTAPSWLQHISLVLLLPVFPLLMAAYFPGRIKALTKHPMLLAIKIWSFSHLLASGSIINVILFGSFLVWAVLDRISVNHRSPRAVPGAPAAKYNDIIALIVGIGLYLAFILRLHNWFIGVSPV